MLRGWRSRVSRDAFANNTFRMQQWWDICSHKPQHIVSPDGFNICFYFCIYIGLDNVWMCDVNGIVCVWNFHFDLLAAAWLVLVARGSPLADAAGRGTSGLARQIADCKAKEFSLPFNITRIVFTFAAVLMEYKSHFHFQNCSEHNCCCWNIKLVKSVYRAESSGSSSYTWLTWVCFGALT